MGMCRARLGVFEGMGVSNVGGVSGVSALIGSLREGGVRPVRDVSLE
jgi:hypothetical protein